MSAVTPAGGDTVAAYSWPGVLDALLSGADQSADATAWAMDQIMSGEATDAQIAGFMVALRAKGETVAEITGLVRAMYAHAHLIEVPGRSVDIVGTGGDGAKTVNISTMSAIVVAGHRRQGRQARQPRRLLGQRRLRRPGEARRQSANCPRSGWPRWPRRPGITFCFAVKFHPALRYVAAARSELGIRTTFNVLGPLTNPAKVRAQATGVADPGWRRSWRACSPSAARPRWSSAATTAWTN